MNDVIDEALHLSREAAHHAFTAVVLALCLPLLALAFIMALLCDTFTPRRVYDVSSQPDRDAA
jgi:hypothetical protein